MMSKYLNKLLKKSFKTPQVHASLTKNTYANFDLQTNGWK